jgi:hypothetical protein
VKNLAPLGAMAASDQHARRRQLALRVPSRPTARVEILFLQGDREIRSENFCCSRACGRRTRRRQRDPPILGLFFALPISL